MVNLWKRKKFKPYKKDWGLKISPLAQAIVATPYPPIFSSVRLVPNRRREENLVVSTFKNCIVSANDVGEQNRFWLHRRYLLSFFFYFAISVFCHKRREDVEKFWRSLRTHLKTFLQFRGVTLTISSIYCWILAPVANSKFRRPQRLEKLNSPAWKIYSPADEVLLKTHFLWGYSRR